ARDVNPVGIYGTVSLTTIVGPRFAGKPRITYAISDDLTSARVTVRGSVANPGGEAVELTLGLSDEGSLAELGTHKFTLPTNRSDGAFAVTFEISGIALWHPWDQGDQPLYRLRM